MENLRYLMYILSGIGGISCIFFYRSLPPVFLRLGAYLLFAMISQALAFPVARHFGNNIIYYNVVILINYLLTYAIFWQMSSNSQYKRKISIFFAAGGLVIVYFVIQSFTTSFASKALTIFNIAATIFALLYFYQILRVPDDQPVLQKGTFWIASGFLIHHLASFSYWLFFDYRSHSPDRSLILTLSIFLGILLYTVLLAGIFVQLKFGKHDRA